MAALHREDDERRVRDVTYSLLEQGDALQRSGLLEQGVGAFGVGAGGGDVVGRTGLDG